MAQVVTPSQPYPTQLGQHVVLSLPEAAPLATRNPHPATLLASLDAHFQIHSRAEGSVAATALPSTWPAFLQKTYW